MIRLANRTSRFPSPGTASRSGQEGFTLVELAVVTAVLSIAAIWQGSRIMQEVNDVAAEATGTYLHAVKGAVDNMIMENFDQIAARTATLPGFANVLAPTIQELRAKGHLLRTFNDTTPFGQEVAIRIQVSSQCPGQGCRIDGLTFTTTPLKLQSVEPREDLIARAVMATAGHGGAAYSRAPAEIRGSTFSVPNPLGSTPGIIGIVSSLDTTMFNQFVRVNDLRNPNLKGDFSVDGTIASKSKVTVSDSAGTPCVNAEGIGVITISCQGRLNAKTGVFTADNGATVQIDPQTGVVTSERVNASKGFTSALGSVFNLADGTPTVKAATSQLQLATGAGVGLELRAQEVVAAKAVSAETVTLRTIVSAGSSCTNDNGVRLARNAAGGLLVCHPASGIWVQIGTVAEPGQACSPNGSFATSRSQQGLVCRLGVYIDANDLFPTYVMVDTHLVAHGDAVLKPQCGHIAAGVYGSPLIYLIPSKESSKASAFTRQATDNGGSWSVSLRDYDGTPLGGAAQALAHIYCKY